MSDLFEGEDDLIEEVFTAGDSVSINSSEIAASTILDARRRLEQALEEKRLREELDDFMDY